MHKFLEYKVGQYMTPDPLTVEPALTLRELDALFTEHNFNAFPVMDRGHLVGFVTKFDFLKAFAFATARIMPHYDHLMEQPVDEIMTRAVIHADVEAPLTHTLQLMVELRARSFPVLDKAGKLVGVIAREDLMRALKDSATG